jgi:hypothetical protein
VESNNSINYVLNITPTKALTDTTLEETWRNIKPYVIRFHVFGSEVWAHHPNEKRKALEIKSDKCIIVGYSKNVKGRICSQFQRASSLLDKV